MSRSATPPAGCPPRAGSRRGCCCATVGTGRLLRRTGRWSGSPGATRASLDTCRGPVPRRRARLRAGLALRVLQQRLRGARRRDRGGGGRAAGGRLPARGRGPAGMDTFDLRLRRRPRAGVRPSAPPGPPRAARWTSGGTTWSAPITGARSGPTGGWHPRRSTWPVSATRCVVGDLLDPPRAGRRARKEGRLRPRDRPLRRARDPLVRAQWRIRGLRDGELDRPPHRDHSGGGGQRERAGRFAVGLVLAVVEGGPAGAARDQRGRAAA